MSDTENQHEPRQPHGGAPDDPTTQFGTEPMSTDPTSPAPMSQGANPTTPIAPIPGEPGPYTGPPPSGSLPSGSPQGQPGTPGPAPKPSFWYRQRTALLTGAAALIVGGLIGGSIGWATGHDDSHTQPVAAAAQHDKKARRDAALAAGRRGVAGEITAINGQTWTIQTHGGKTVTVDITGDTHFGTERKPQEQSDFAVGDRVLVAGTRSGDTVTARIVAKRPTPANSATPQASGAPAPASAQPS
ncbi:hypothetical protein EF294_21410 [Gordonia oryzae]|uniref:DUF5666 domain-containing protein n=1 Tax=Gordonia oryzae TaxID=2487349 RepID=A0A3N4GAF1_9ACTN|nr:DUF5666 domain-containing protein [Gordonia oryzae]RPA55961.1 hypothetical protein EF294_21410 [Gordonia oryzae]